MDLITRMVEHHIWLTGEMLSVAAELDADDLEQPIGGVTEEADQTIRSLLARLTGRRVQVSALLVPSLVLHTIGARSGQPREAPLMYTPDGAGNAETEITPGRRVPNPVGELGFGIQTSWELDVWGKLRDLRGAAPRGGEIFDDLMIHREEARVGAELRRHIGDHGALASGEAR